VKVGTPEHPKTLMLAASLEFSKKEVTGLLELLWHFTARYAPQGNIGKFPAAMIAGAVDYTEGSPERLMEALHECGWLDTHAEHGFLVHDWRDHCPDRTDKWLLDNDLIYADGQPTKRTTKGNGKSRDPVATKSRQSRTKSDKVGQSRSTKGSTTTTTTTKESTNTKGKKGAAVPPDAFVEFQRLVQSNGFNILAGDEFLTLYKTWAAYRVKIKKPLSEEAVKIDCAHMLQVMEAGGTANIIGNWILDADYNGWQGWFFPEKFADWKASRSGPDGGISVADAGLRRREFIPEGETDGE